MMQDALCEELGVNENYHLMKHIDPLYPHLYVELEAITDRHFDQEYILLQ